MNRDENDHNIASNKCFIAVHAGAGYHSTGKETEYRKTCAKACRQAMMLLKKGASAVEGASAAIRCLEDAACTNAGTGSSLTMAGTVECDASIMDGNTLKFGAVGAMSGVRNPILVAKKLLEEQIQGPLSLGRIAPCTMVGEGATDWAKTHEIPVVLPHQLKTDMSIETYTNHKRRLDVSEERRNKKRQKYLRKNNADLQRDIADAAEDAIRNKHDVNDQTTGVSGVHGVCAATTTKDTINVTAETENNTDTILPMVDGKHSEQNISVSMHDNVEKSTTNKDGASASDIVKTKVQDIDNENQSVCVRRRLNLFNDSKEFADGDDTDYETKNAFDNTQADTTNCIAQDDYTDGVQESFNKEQGAVRNVNVDLQGTSTTDGVNLQGTSTAGGVNLQGTSMAEGVVVQGTSMAEGVVVQGTSIADGENDRLDEVQDTVGAICIDCHGNVAVGVSSGGVSLKQPGRLGPAAVYGAGCWAKNWRSDNNPGVAVATSGTGEHLMGTLLARTCGENLQRAELATEAIDSTFTQQFLESEFLADTSHKYGGLIALKLETMGENCHCELLWGHTTASMSLGYMASSGRLQTVISRLDDHKCAGQSYVMEGRHITL